MKKWQKIGLGFTGVLFACCILTLVGGLLMGDQVANMAGVDSLDEVAEPEDTTERDDVPDVVEEITPTEVIVQPTENPNMKSGGTYLVGTEIQPGFYKGYGGLSLMDSCYWERKSDLSGDFESIISNDNASGPFYIEVLATDVALKIDCDFEYLEVLPNPVAEFPSSVGVGTYLVGIDIAAGYYRGQAGDDLMDSCYWERKTNLLGNFDSIISNDNAVGQYYIEVLASDMALEVGCELDYLVALPAPLAEMPTILSPGTYLVGIDIAPGLYKGEAGDDLMESCYWERKSGLLGGFSSIIGNDNATGQFYVDIGAGDFAFTTGCELSLQE